MKYFIIIFSSLLLLFITCQQQQYRGCRDEDSYWSCYYSLLSGMCTNRYYYDHMYRTCRSTCNLCPDYHTTNTNIKIQPKNKELNECKDEKESCIRWKRHCKNGGDYYDYMLKNCRRTCLFCADQNCTDENINCAKYSSYGYCELNHKYYDYMNKNCAKSCEFCLYTEQNVNKTLKTITKKEFACNFEEHSCDWENSHFEDTCDWKVGLVQNGPKLGYNGTNKYLYLDAAHRHMEGKLWLPWLLVLTDESNDHGVMCMNFFYQLTGGKLLITQNAVPTAIQKFPRPSILLSTDKIKNSWTHMHVNVRVNNKYQLFIIGQKGRPQTYIVIDELFFTHGKC